MKIDNQTEWKTEHLRKIIIETTDRALLDAGFRKNLKVDVSYRRRGGRFQDNCPRTAFYYGRPLFSMTLVKGVAPDKQKLAKEIALAIAHCQPGVTGYNKGCQHWGWKQNWRLNYEWVLGFPLEAKPSKEAPREASVLDGKIKHCQEMANVWDHRERAAMNKKSSWLRRLRRYEARLDKAHNAEVKEALAEVMAENDGDETPDFDLTSGSAPDTVAAVND